MSERDSPLFLDVTDLYSWACRHTALYLRTFYSRMQASKQTGGTISTSSRASEWSRGEPSIPGRYDPLFLGPSIPGCAAPLFLRPSIRVRRQAGEQAGRVPRSLARERESPPLHGPLPYP